MHTYIRKLGTDTSIYDCFQVQADAALMQEINEMDKKKLAQERERQETSLRDTAQLAGTDFPPIIPEGIPPIRILCATWNLGEAPCTEISLCAWLPPAEFDIYVVAAQHLGDQKQRCVTVVSQLCLSCVSVVPQLCLSCASVVPQLCLSCVSAVPQLSSVVSQLCLSCVSVVSQLCLSCVSVVFQSCLNCMLRTRLHRFSAGRFSALFGACMNFEMKQILGYICLSACYLSSVSRVMHMCPHTCICMCMSVLALHKLRQMCIQTCMYAFMHVKK